MKIIFLILILFISKPAYADEIPFFGIFPKIAVKQWYVSHGWANGDHQACEWRKELVRGHDGGIRLTLSDHGGKIRAIGCGEIQSQKKFGFGRYEARLKTAAGSGLNSAFFTYIGPPMGSRIHDEIDFEFLGKDKKTVQVGYWQNGVNREYKVIDLGFDASADFHDYAFEWYSDKIIWYADGREIFRTSGKNPIPQTPSKIFFSLWSGTKIQDDWLGKFKYSAPKNMDVKWVKYNEFK